MFELLNKTNKAQHKIVVVFRLFSKIIPKVEYERFIFKRTGAGCIQGV